MFEEYYGRQGRLASLMVWSNTTGSNVARRSERVVFASMLTASCHSARSQGVAGVSNGFKVSENYG